MTAPLAWRAYKMHLMNGMAILIEHGMLCGSGVPLINSLQGHLANSVWIVEGFSRLWAVERDYGLVDLKIISDSEWMGFNYEIIFKFQFGFGFEFKLQYVFGFEFELGFGFQFECEFEFEFGSESADTSSSPDAKFILTTEFCIDCSNRDNFVPPSRSESF